MNRRQCDSSAPHVVMNSAVAGLGLAALTGVASHAADLFQRGPLRKICDRRGDCVVAFNVIPKSPLWVVN